MVQYLREVSVHFDTAIEKSVPGGESLILSSYTFLENFEITKKLLKSEVKSQKNSCDFKITKVMDTIFGSDLPSSVPSQLSTF